MMNAIPLLVCLLLGALSFDAHAACLVLAQEKQEGPAPDERRIEAAVQRGVRFLRLAPAPAGPEGLPDSDELHLWTLLHVGVAEQDAQVQALLQKVLAAPLERTFNVALQAMCLEELDRVKYQARIYPCAQFLLDNQAVNGEWGGGEPTNFEELAPLPPPPRPAPAPRAFNNNPPGAKPVVRRKVRVVKQRDGPPTGDAANSFFAALGLRACFDAGMLLPQEVLEKAQARWTEGAASETTVEGTVRRSWSDSAGATGGAVASVAILQYLQGRDWKKSRDVGGGLEWLGRHSKADGPLWDLYRQERAGMLVGVERFGGRAWYPPFVKALLGTQHEDGSWGRHDRAADNVRDTCLALLVLHKRRPG